MAWSIIFDVAEYRPQELDRKWQQRWVDTRAFEPTEDPTKPKFYCLEMFAYPSGHAHVGHVRNYIIGDVMARTRRMRGFNVLHPFGWDAFGLPAENAAIKGGIHPEVSTFGNIEHMKGQLKRLGISYAWDREIATCTPEYYKWNQWLFIRMYERGLAYRRRSTVNWCPVDLTVLANEQVVDGACWRCGTAVVQRDLEQWFLKITHYADELLQSLDTLTKWPEKVLTMQRNWIGRSEGARVRFPLAPGAPDAGPNFSPDASGLPADIEVFTTRIDTIYGATFVLLAPEHPLVESLAATTADPKAFRAQVTKFRTQDRTARMSGRGGEGRRLHRPVRGQPVHGRAGADLGRQLRARRVRHRRGDGRAGARRARLRVRAQVRAADSGRRSARRCRGAVRRQPHRGRLQRRHHRELGAVGRPAVRRGASEDDRRGPGTRHRRGHRAVPPEGLGHLAAALLGHADPDGLLRERRRAAGPRRPAARSCCRR